MEPLLAAGPHPLVLRPQNTSSRSPETERVRRTDLGALHVVGDAGTHLGSWFEPDELRWSDVGSVVNLVLDTFSDVQEVETTLITAEHVLLLHTQTHTPIH